MSGLLGSTTKLIVGRGLSIGLGIVSAPLVARLYLPEHFGVYGVLTATANWLIPFGGLGYYQALPLAEKDNEIRTLTLWSFCSTLALALLIWLGFSLGEERLVGLLKSPQARSWLWSIPILFFLLSLTNLNHNLLSRVDRFGALAFCDALNQNSGRLITILWGWLLGAGTLGLLLGSMLGAVLGLTLGLVVGARSIWPGQGESPPGFAPLRETLVRHQQFPKVQMWNFLLQTTSRSLPIIIITYGFGVEVVGFFQFARNIAALPLQLLAVSLNQAFYPQAAAEFRQQGSMAESIRQGVKILAVTCVFPAMVLALMAPLLFDLVFGVRWHEAAIYAQMLSPLMLISLNAAFRSVFLVLDRADLSLKYTILDAATQLGAVSLGLWLGSPRAVVFLFSLTGSVITAIMVAHCLRLGGMGWAEMASPYLREAGRGLLLIWPAALSYWWGGAGLGFSGSADRGHPGRMGFGYTGANRP